MMKHIFCETWTETFRSADPWEEIQGVDAKTEGSH